MTTCAYCRRQYAQPPAECAGCGAPLPDTISDGDWSWHRHCVAALNAQLNDISTPYCMGLGSHYGYAHEMLEAQLGTMGDKTTPTANDPAVLLMEYQDLIRLGESRRITPRHVAAAQDLGDPMLGAGLVSRRTP